jgi:DNA-binding NarL/FixJ family response regulator
MRVVLPELARALRDVENPTHERWLSHILDALRPYCRGALVMIQQPVLRPGATDLMHSDDTLLAARIRDTSQRLPEVATTASTHVAFAGRLRNLTAAMPESPRRVLLGELGEWGVSDLGGILANHGPPSALTTLSILWPFPKGQKGRAQPEPEGLRFLLPELWHGLGLRERAARNTLSAQSGSGGNTLWDDLLHGEATVVGRHGDTRQGAWLVGGRPDPRRLLTVRERFTIERASRGASNKEVAFELGVTVGSVGSHLTRALRKLEVHSRAELCALAAAAHAAAPDFPEANSRGPFVLPRVAYSGGLRSSQQRLLMHVTHGLSNRAIAAIEGISHHTVRNRLDLLMRRFQARSRSELVIRAGGHASSAGT